MDTHSARIEVPGHFLPPPGLKEGDATPIAAILVGFMSRYGQHPCGFTATPLSRTALLQKRESDEDEDTSEEDTEEDEDE